jgi:hypothetical protein
MNLVGILPSQQKRSFHHASIRTRKFSSTCILKEPSRSPPKLTVAELVRKLKIEGHPTSGRLRVRTANAIMRRFEKFLDKQKANHKAVISAIRQRDCQLMAVRFRTAMIEVADLMEEADSVLDSVNRKLVRRVSSKDRGAAKRERLDKKAGKREKKAQKAQKAERAEQKENRARKMGEKRATTTGAPIRKFASFGLSTSSEINKKLQPAVSEVSRLTEEARAIMATIKHSKPHIRRMPVSKLATSQALNQTLGYAIQEILHVTEEARTILATIQQRKRQSSWRFIRRWGRDATSVPLQSVSSPTELLQSAHRMLREARVGIRRLRKEVNIIGTLIRQRKYFLRRSTTDKRRIVQDRSLRIRRISPYTLRVSHYPSRSRIVQEKRGVRVRSQLSTVKFRSSTQRHPILEKKRKSDELAATVASWLGGGGSASNDKSGLDALLATVEREESQDRRGGRRRRR